MTATVALCFSWGNWVPALLPYLLVCCISAKLLNPPPLLCPCGLPSKSGHLHRLCEFLFRRWNELHGSSAQTTAEHRKHACFCLLLAMFPGRRSRPEPASWGRAQAHCHPAWGCAVTRRFLSIRRWGRVLVVQWEKQLSSFATNIYSAVLISTSPKA